MQHHLGNYHPAHSLMQHAHCHQSTAGQLTSLWRQHDMAATLTNVAVLQMRSSLVAQQAKRPSLDGTMPMTNSAALG